MHELSIMESVLEMIRESARERNIIQVNRIRLVIGKLTMIMPDSLEFSFQVLSQDDLFQNAGLEIEERDIVIRCEECGQESVLPDGYSFLCPACGTARVEMISGREMYIDYYEGDSN